MARFEISKTDDQTMTLSGVVDVDNAMALKSEGEELLRSLKGDIVIDLKGVEHSSSVGVSVLLCWLRAAKAAGNNLVFRAMPAKMFDVARVSGLDDVLPLKENGQSEAGSH